MSKTINYIVLCDGQIVTAFSNKRKAESWARDMPQGRMEVQSVEVDAKSIPSEKLYHLTWKDYYCDGKTTPYECYMYLVGKEPVVDWVETPCKFDVCLASLMTIQIEEADSYPYALTAWIYARNIKQVKYIVEEKLRAWQPKPDELKWDVYYPLDKSENAKKAAAKRLKNYRKKL